MPFRSAALAEPLAVAWHAVRLGLGTLSTTLPAARCCVLGGGAIGVGAALTLHCFGAGRIDLAEPHQERRRAAALLPVTPYSPGSDAEPPAGSVDLVIDAVGASATREAACRMAKPGGTIVHIGLLPGEGGLDVRRMTLQEISFRGAYCYTDADFRDVVAMLARNGFGPLRWVDEMPLEEGSHAFSALDAAEVVAAKIILRP